MNSAPRMNRNDRADGALRQRLGAALRRERRARGLTQGQVADRAGFGVKYYSDVERGQANFSISAFEALADALGWDPMTAVNEPLSEPVRTLLVSELQQVGQRIQTMREWLIALGQRMAGNGGAR